jgi:hypothetical protein
VRPTAVRPLNCWAGTAEAQHTAARAKILAAFSTQQGYQADGQYGPRPWLRAFTKVTNQAAAGAVGWASR